MAYRRHNIRSEGAEIADVFGPVTSPTYLDQITMHFSSAPATAGTLSVVRESAEGEPFDTTIYALDPSNGATTDVFVPPADLGLLLLPGDALRVTYANADRRAIGIQFVLR